MFLLGNLDIVKQYVKQKLLKQEMCVPLIELSIDFDINSYFKSDSWKGTF